MKRLICIILAICASALLNGCTEPDTKNSSYTAPMEGYVVEGAVSAALQALDEEDVSLMARLVAAEAGSMPYMTQVCLAALVLNRLEDATFPATVREIVYDSSDFESVRRGIVSAHPDGNEDSPKDRVALRAVRAALEGEDPTGGALYFSRVGSPDMFVSGGYQCGGMVFGK